ncbi:MAG TPA: sugar kinase [Sphingomicrobium sp.]
MTDENRIVVVGEGMVELSGSGRQVRLGYGGDTLNTAIHLARYGLNTAFLTALGTDKFSGRLRADWADEGLDTALILSDPERNPGLYAITTDRRGERSFTYWRSRSAARRMFDLEGAKVVLERASDVTLLYFSLISLAILPPRGRDRLLRLATRVREQGGRVAFDSNCRPRLWRSSGEARRMRDAAIALCDIGLPTLQDERQLSGFQSAASVVAHWRALGVGEVVVKMGSEGAFVDGTPVAPPAPLKPVDTTGAGDAFNAAYLAARLRGKSPAEAASSGHELAGWVVMRNGAIPPADRTAPYQKIF